MNRAQLNLIIDLLAATSMLVMVATGYVLRFPLPPGTNRTNVLWNLARHEWGLIHAWASVGLLLVIIVHVVLHWSWIVTMISRRFTRTKKAASVRPLLSGVITIVALIALAGMWALATHASVRERTAPLHLLNNTSDVTGQASTLPATSPMFDAEEPSAVDFWRDVMPVFEAACINCHGPEKQRADFRVDRRDDFFSTRDGEKLLVPYFPDESKLLQIVSGEIKSMKRREDHLMPPTKIALLKTWIIEGADWPEVRTKIKSNKPPSSPIRETEK